MKIITTVGTSLITNSEIDCSSLENQQFEESYFNGKPDSNLKKTIIDKESRLLKYIQNNSASAELASIKKIDPKDEAQIYLICTETITSNMCGRVLKKYLGDRAQVQYIKGLQVQNLAEFKKNGVVNLLLAIENTAQGGNYWDDLILNVTGGYKAIIPIMTIIGQIKKLPIYYLFNGEEDQNYELIQIPRLPIDYQVDIFEKFWQDFTKFGLDGSEYSRLSNHHHDFCLECSGCLEVVDEILMLNPIGKILWWNYQQQFFCFKAPESIWKEMQSQKRLLDFVKQSFQSVELRESQNVSESTHKTVMKKAHDTIRIYWFYENGIPYIYKTFEDHDDHENYINATKFDALFKNEVIRNSKLFRIKTK